MYRRFLMQSENHITRPKFQRGIELENRPESQRTRESGNRPEPENQRARGIEQSSIEPEF